MPPGMSLKGFRDSVERAFILQRLGEHGWNVSKTAEALDVERTHLHKKMSSSASPAGVELGRCSLGSLDAQRAAGELEAVESERRPPRSNVGACPPDVGAFAGPGIATLVLADAAQSTQFPVQGSLYHMAERKRDDFNNQTKELLARRVGHKCSLPDCQAPTSGPGDPEDWSNMGTAAHIRAASELGPRFDPTQTPQERKSLDNGIWVCANHGRHIDNVVSTYTVEELERIKREAEERARQDLGGPPANLWAA